MDDCELAIGLPNGKTQLVKLDRDRFTLGRDAANDLAFPDVAGLSRKHLAIRRDGANWVAEDLGSTYGTFLNKTRIAEPKILRPNDQIKAGELHCTFSTAAARAARTVVFVENPSGPAITASLDAVLKDAVLNEECETSQSGHIQALIRAGRELAGHMPLDTLFELILTLSVDAAKATRGALMTLEDGELRIRAHKGDGLRISSRVRDLVMGEKRSMLVHDALMDESLGARMSIVQDQIRSMLAVPLQTEDRVIGLIYLDSPFLIREFTKADLSLLTVMGNIAAVRIEHARMAEMEQAEKLRAQEMQHAAMIQRAILPSNFPPFPERTEFQLHAAMTPAKGIGGDLFDFFLLDDNHLAFAVGDVSGKGVPAALFMAVARTLLRSTAQHKASPAKCMAYLNAALVEQNVSGMFVTLFYGVMDTRTGEMEFANAGHMLPYVFSATGEMRELTHKSGPMVGLFPKFAFTQGSARLQRGETMVIYTDGLTEARDPQGDFFEEDRLKASLQTHATKAVEPLLAGLLGDVETFAAGAPQADDITALALRYLGPA